MADRNRVLILEEFREKFIGDRMHDLKVWMTEIVAVILTDPEFVSNAIKEKYACLPTASDPKIVLVTYHQLTTDPMFQTDLETLGRSCTVVENFPRLTKFLSGSRSHSDYIERYLAQCIACPEDELLNGSYVSIETTAGGKELQIVWNSPLYP